VLNLVLFKTATDLQDSWQELGDRESQHSDTIFVCSSFGMNLKNIIFTVGTLA
jgi:hypothetical protein